MTRWLDNEALDTEAPVPSTDYLRAIVRHMGLDKLYGPKAEQAAHDRDAELAAEVASRLAQLGQPAPLTPSDFRSHRVRPEGERGYSVAGSTLRMRAIYGAHSVAFDTSYGEHDADKLSVQEVRVLRDDLTAWLDGAQTALDAPTQRERNERAIKDACRLVEIISAPRDVMANDDAPEISVEQWRRLYLLIDYVRRNP